MTAVAQVTGEQLDRQSDKSLLLPHVQAERHDALRSFLGDAPSFNVVFFSKV